MKFAEATPTTVQGLWSSVRPSLESATALEEAAQSLATAVHQTFSESVAIARVFVTVPFMSLPSASKQFVQKLAESAQAAEELRPTTPVLSLVGTHGKEADWCDRQKSKGHAGIPLISSSFVDAIPMIARLLKELGVPMHWIDSHDSEIIKKSVGRSSGLFYVDDAGKATDQKGRKIIAAQDFVTTHKIRSVFGIGSAYASGQIVVMVVFCQDSLSREVAEQFVVLADSFKDKTAGLVGNAKIFVGGGR